MPETTNNRAELTALLQALCRLGETEEREALIVSDSKYVVDGCTQWLAGWEKKGWVNSEGEPVKNRDIWEALLSVLDLFEFKLTFRHIRGHQGNKWNERVDETCSALRVRPAD